jgi:hypothetical protein
MRNYKSRPLRKAGPVRALPVSPSLAPREAFPQRFAQNGGASVSAVVKNKGRTGFAIPVSNGIFAHRHRIDNALWEFLWFIDHVTKEEPGDDGEYIGHVLGGAPVPIGRIARELQEPTRTAQRHVAHLVGESYILRTSVGAGDAHRYAVRKSKKWTRIHSVLLPDATSAKNGAPPAKFGGPPPKMAQQ